MLGVGLEIPLSCRARLRVDIVGLFKAFVSQRWNKKEFKKNSNEMFLSEPSEGL